jgi:SecD/SecF fusion protein
MQRNFLRGLLICLIPCLLAAVFAVRPEKYRLGIDLAGGTILVYEINIERTKQRIEAQARSEGRPPPATGEEGLDSNQMQELAHQIKRRIDPTDIKNVTVRPIGRTRFEIILPKSGAAGSGRENLSTEDIEEVKRLISQMGVLEFRILANGTDDSEGIIAARAAIDNKPADLLLDNAKAGLAPPGPEGEYTVTIGESTARVRYEWVELGKVYREEMGLSNSSEGKSPLWAQVAAERAKGKTFLLGQGHSIVQDTSTASAVMYSREARGTDQLQAEQNERERLRRENPSWSDEELEQHIDRKKYEYFILTRVSPDDSVRVGGNITLTANAGTDQSFNPSVDFTFNSAGAQQFGKITRRNKPTGSMHRQLAIILDEKMVSSPNLQSEITSRGQITGKFDKKSVNQLVQILRSGALSAELRQKPVSENTIGPTLGKDTIRKGTMAVGMAFLAVLGFMLWYYRFAGMVACIALFANLLLTIGFMVAVNAAFTLPGLAGLVLTLGMAVDANVLIYERLREERDKGANLATAIRNGYERAFLTIIDTHLTSIFTAVVLYTFGNDQLKGFAISLSVGLIISLFTSLYMTRLLFDYWLHRRWLTELKMMRLFGKLGFHPMRFRYYFFSLTGALTILGLGLFLYRGESGLNVDFRGGTVFSNQLKDGEERALTTVGDKPGFRELLSEENQKAKLKPTRAVWENKEGDAATANTFVYTITYDEGAGKTSTSTVTLTQKPAGNTDEEMAQDVIARASILPDVSVEQMFLSGQTFPDGKSKYFTIRTTEKQPELVRATLDRLLRDENGNSLMAGASLAYATAPGTTKNREGKDVPLPAVTVTDLKDKGKTATVTLEFSKPTSRAFVQELIEREYRTERLAERSANLSPDSDPVDGRFTRMKLDVSKNEAFAKLASDKPEDAAEKAKQLALLGQILDSVKRSFDTAPEPERLEVFDSQLAKDTRTKAMIAIIVSWIAIILYLWLRFGNWTFGLAAVLCLIHDLCFTLGAIAACHYLHLIPGFSHLGIQDFKIDLAAVAALLTLVGYSVNEIIVNFARVREVRGKNPLLTPQMINDSVNQTLSRTMLTSMTVFLVSIVLYAFGGEGVHLFAFVMMMGVMVSTYSAIFVACPLLLFLGEGREAATAEALAAAEEAAEAEAEEKEEVVEG